MTRLFKVRDEHFATRRRSRVAAGFAMAAASAALVVLPSTPASATTSTTVEFTGEIHMSNDRAIFPTVPWGMGSSTCIAGEASTVTLASATPFCTLTATGVINGPCGAGAGSGSLYLNNVGAAGNVSASIRVQEAGAILSFTGTAFNERTGESGTVIGNAVVTPLSTNCTVFMIHSATLQFTFGV